MNRLLTGTALGLMLSLTPALAQDPPPAEPAPSATPPAAAPAEPAPDATPTDVTPTEDPGDRVVKPSDDTGESVVQTPPESMPADETMPSATAANVEFIPAQKPGDWLATNVIGETITNAQDEGVGDINDVIVDENGKVLGAIVGVGGFLGIGEKNVAIKWESLNVMPQTGGEEKVKIGLDVTRDALESAPSYALLEENETASSQTQTEMETPPAEEPGDTPPPRP